MGIPYSTKSEKTNLYQNLKESWKYAGKIYQNIYNEFLNENKEINLYFLNGKIYISGENKKNKIKIVVHIEGEMNEDVFCGEEIGNFKNINEEKILFKILNEENFELNIVELTKYKDKNGCDILKGDNIYIMTKNGIKSGPLFLNLNLKDHKEYIQDIKYNFLNIKASGIKLSKTIDKNNPVDIIKKSLCGIDNLINTCYINSSLQIIIHIPQFIKIIMEKQKYEIKIIKEINDIFKKILKIYKEYKPTINPKFFVYFFKSNHHAFNNYSQMDSEMFLEVLIWDINSELGKLKEKRNNELLDIKEKNEKQTKFIKYINEIEKETNFKINNLFYVYFIHEKRCKNCGYSTYYFDESPGLKLNFENTEYISKIDIVSLIINNFKNPLEIKSHFLCQKCMKCYDLIKETKIAKLPEILILSLQKVNKENTRKIPWIVDYGENTIEINNIVDTQLINNSSCLYKIFAINNHLGNTPQSGHYFSEIYLKDLNAWYSFNDESVDIDSNWNIPKISNYILFYEQIK